MKATAAVLLLAVVPGFAAPVAESTVEYRQFSYGKYSDYGAYTDISGKGYGDYGAYPVPEGGYTTYKRAVDWAKSFFA